MTREEAIKTLIRSNEYHHARGDMPHSIKSIEAFEMIISALEQQPCEDAVSREAVLKKIDYEVEHYCKYLEGADDKRNAQTHVALVSDNIREEVEQLPSVTRQTEKWIPISKRLPTKEEYIANNGLFIVSDGNRTYAEYFDIYDSMKYFGEPTMNGFRVDRCVVAWMPLPELYKEEGVE